jgi:hypothetical protein
MIRSHLYRLELHVSLHLIDHTHPVATADPNCARSFQPAIVSAPLADYLKISSVTRGQWVCGCQRWMPVRPDPMSTMALLASPFFNPGTRASRTHVQYSSTNYHRLTSDGWAMTLIVVVNTIIRRVHHMQGILPSPARLDPCPCIWRRCCSPPG